MLRSDGITERAIFLIDPKGNLRYIDIHDIDDQPSNEVLIAEIQKINPEIKTITLNEVEDELPTGGVIMYCNDWCPDCRKARVWLEEQRISYSEINVEKNRKAAQQVRKWADGNLITPTFDINGKIIIDFDKNQLEKALKKS